jgi:hypothetical protein
VSAAISLPRDASSSRRKPRLAAISTCQGPAPGGASSLTPGPDTSSRWVIHPSALSSSPRARHHPSSTRTSPRLPCRSLARSSRGSRHDPSGSYSGHTPSLRHLKHPADQGQAPGTTPAPADLPRLADDLHPSVHVASGCYPAGLCTVCLGFPTSIVSARLEPCDFSGSKLEAPGYPSVRGFHGSAPSPLGFTGKPSPGLSWLSYSRRSVSLRPRPQFGRLRPSRS